jgi:N-acetylmuramoyl-L-alanine amidase
MKRVAVVLLCLLLAACATGPVIDTSYRSISHGSRVRFLVLHYTEGNFAGSLDILTRGPVSSHYLVRDDPPRIFALVDESRRAWHAGAGSWLGNPDINSVSIGIEIVNRGGNPETGVWAEYPQAQMDLVMWLVEDIVRRHQIPPERIIGHSDLAPQRKIDPGPRFPWKRLADAGFIRWPDEAEVARRLPAFAQSVPDAAWFQLMLAKHGFGVPMHGVLDEPTRRVIAAFQMKYRQGRYDGMPDAETAAILDVLVNP